MGVYYPLQVMTLSTAKPYRYRFFFGLITHLIWLFVNPFPAFPQGNHTTDSLYTLLKESKKKASILNALAAEYLYISPLKSMQIAAEAEEAARNERNGIEEANALHNTACAYMALGKYDTTNLLLERSRRIFSRFNNMEGLLRIDNSLANLNYMQGRLDEARRMYEDNLIKARKAKLPALEVSAITNIGRINWLQGRYDTALLYYQEALKKADSINNASMQGMIHLLTGIAFQDKGYYEMAAGKMLLAKELFEKMNYLSKLAYTYNYLGSVYYELQENENALAYYRKALDSFRQNDDDWGNALTSRYLGMLFQRLRLSDSARYYFLTSLTLAHRLNDWSGELYSQRFLGEVLLESGNIDSARIFFLDNIRKSGILKNMREKVNNLYDLGLLNVQEKKYSDALGLFHEAGKLADSIGLFYENMLINKQLSETYEITGDLASSLRYYKIYKSLNDTIFSTTKRKNIDELQLRYETEKKNSEITSLKLEQEVQAARLRNQRIFVYTLTSVLIMVLATIVILWRSYKQKKESDREKEILLKEIHHRVKNNLQTISSLLSLQSYTIRDTKVRDAVRESQDRVKSMALIHQMLYQQEELSKIDFGKYLDQLVANIASVYGKQETNINCTIACQDAGIDIDTTIPLGLIANELIVNAFKYAFDGRERGNIIISLNRQPDGKMLLRVRDDGRGMPDNFHIDKTETLGLKLVSLLTRQLKGEVTCISQNGTEFLITF